MHQNAIINCLPESLQDDEIPSTVYSFSNTIRNKCFNQEDNVNNINTDNTSNYGNGVSSCNRASCKSLSHHQEHIVTGYLLIIRGKKSCKIISEGLNYREPETINFRQSKVIILKGLDSLIEGKLLTNKKTLWNL